MEVKDYRYWGTERRKAEGGMRKKKAMKNVEELGASGMNRISVFRAFSGDMWDAGLRVGL